MPDKSPAETPSAVPPADVAGQPEPPVASADMTAVSSRHGDAAGRPQLYNGARVAGRSAYLLVVLAMLLSLTAGFAGGWLGAISHDNSDAGSQTATVTPAAQQQVAASESQLIAGIAKAVGPSVVSVNVTSLSSSPAPMNPMDLFGLGGGGGLPQAQKDAGTGIILSSDGLIITNRHVVPAGTTHVSVTLADGTRLNDVTVVGRTNPSDPLDIAFLKIQNTQGHKLVPATLGDSSQMQVGDLVVAIGNALGQFQNTVTSGIISGYGRSVQASSSNGSSTESLSDLFQTDAAINEGNSGGPLVNAAGQVIGINTAISGQGQNIGFAIPINDVKGLITQVLRTGTFQRPYIGIRYIPLTADVAHQLGLGVTNGAYIAPAVDPAQPSVVPGSPAAKAGLQVNDIITAVDGTKLDATHSLTALINQHAVGDSITLTVLRGGKTISVKLTLAAAPAG